MLELREPSNMNLRSNHETWKLLENRVPDPSFTNRCFKYIAPHLYNSLTKTTRQIENIETFKKKTENIHIQ